MEKNTVISDGDKLRLIREKYCLKQDEISGNDITRNLISEIETNKANITKNTAEVIIKNLNELGKKRHFKVTETVEYLLENTNSQANKILSEYIEELKAVAICKDDSFAKILIEIEEFLVNWDITSKKIQVYEMAGDYFYNKNEIYKSVLYYEKELTLIDKNILSRTLITVLRKLSMVYTYIDKYEESIKCCEFALTHFRELPKEDSVIFRFNRALCYKKIGKFKQAIEDIEMAEELVDKVNKVSTYVNILINKSNCLYRLNTYDEALSILNEILNLIDKNDLEKQILIRINIINNYIKVENIEKVKEELKIILKCLKNCTLSIEYGQEIYYEMGKIYKYVNENNLEEEYYLKALNLAEKQKNYTLVNEVICDLIDMYSRLNELKKMNDIKNKVFFISSIIESINEKIMFKLISFYSKNGDNFKTKEIAEFSLKSL
ncbi:helix-turn-helix transcriptional regulator [Clostridium hydrogenum]|uniref:helix-turn-helix transcriptional regulator n=1 Tax=Clostridium hydrogenum TaxID=2855764 RepID=UPI001F3012EB|nr:helix-turn-helix transcriptional regulator [Clostridium hydrogenum]